MSETDHVTGGASVILAEARALELLAGSLDTGFSRAVELVLHTTGRVAVTGMGKSGHVARKTAATLASTGTPAFFIHPSEAGHGDLGMLAPSKDVLVAYSNSGETQELAIILNFCARYSIPVIGVTARPGSMLGRHSEVVAALPEVPEACPLGCAPTTSTAMMLAWGDALALTLLSARGFTAEDFRQYHPGGKLGTRLLSVAELMHTGEEVPLASPDTPMSAALMTMTAKRLGCVGITEGGVLAGIVTDGDLRRHMGPDLLNRSARDVMTRNPVSFPPETLAAKALAVMEARGITNAFVVSSDGAPEGVIHIHDLLGAGVA
ncbi:MAG: KpsF/GutQ family sugar-phosphate isomerase [Deltaproteobacteria bacterium]|jgi:arabinose-5-phosphate isomerase|nr:KpsF/GutQ family sugar-phosphate isomerase [Deltaproteobacteria bacterium]